MMITPTATPVATIDQNNVNQSQQNQTNQAKQSKQASDTVQFSSRSLQLASTELQSRPAANNQPVAPQQAADNEASERLADNEAAEQQRPVNPQTRRPETTKIDVLA